MSALEAKLLELLEQEGPLSGEEISKLLQGDQLALWKTCRSSAEIEQVFVGTRYLRLDRRIKGYARLSPSILREFLTYTVIGLSRDLNRLIARAEETRSRIGEISRAKCELAYSLVSALCNRWENEIPIEEHVCFILAGDIVYNMAHDCPRPERSTGKLVRGSDLDLVVVVDDHFPEESVKRLDDAIYREKYRLLITPHIREEIDYVVKGMERVREQVRFDTYRHMVACKIMQEGTLLFGSEEIFHWVKTILREQGIMDRLAAMERTAREFRRRAEEILLTEPLERVKEEGLNLFYPSEESEEFE
ncbi:MAG: hypothetical protein JRJ29_09650 [Deltaproteobacteria bacterium]|nr:hypothetical protein [Deltaproteobacteria bacterium]